MMHPFGKEKIAQALPFSNLLIRTSVSLLLIPFVLLDVWWGGGWFFAMVWILGVAVCREWCRMVYPTHPFAFWLYSVCLSFLLLLFGVYGLEFALIGLFALWGGYLGWLLRFPQKFAFWKSVGLIYLFLPIFCLLFLRQGEVYGFFALLYLFLVVWASDTMAFVFGRILKGPKLCPSVSPNKTWAGLFGALFGGGGVGGALALWKGLPHEAWFLGFGIALALVEQMGDFFESALKRTCGVKDSGTLIPGHGGLLDRVDGLMVAACFMGILAIFCGGVDDLFNW